MIRVWDERLGKFCNAWLLELNLLGHRTVCLTRRGGTKTSSRTTDTDLDCMLANATSFEQWTEIVKSRHKRIELLTRPSWHQPMPITPEQCSQLLTVTRSATTGRLWGWRTTNCSILLIFTAAGGEVSWPLLIWRHYHSSTRLSSSHLFHRRFRRRAKLRICWSSPSYSCC